MHITSHCGTSIVALVAVMVLWIAWQSRHWPADHWLRYLTLTLQNPVFWLLSTLVSTPLSLALFFAFRIAYCSGICWALAAVEALTVVVVACACLILVWHECVKRASRRT